MPTDGWTDRHYQLNSQFSEICEVPNIVHSVTSLKRSQVTDLRLLASKCQTMIIA